MNIYDAFIAATRAHWAAHQNAYPQRIVLSPSQHDELVRGRQIARTGIGSRGPFDHHEFLGVKIERREGAIGSVIAVDGMETPLDL